jgi:predicted DNA-binding transcriptional regulator AlpA
VPHLKAIEQARASALPEIAKTLGIGRASVYSVLEAGQ